MTNFTLITPFDMAMAVTEDTASAARIRLCECASHTASHPLPTSDLIWSATGIAMRHALLLQWMANEARS